MAPKKFIPSNDFKCELDELLHIKKEYDEQLEAAQETAYEGLFRMLETQLSAACDTIKTLITLEEVKETPQWENHYAQKRK